MKGPTRETLIICKFKQPWLKRRIEKLGFPVIEVEPRQFYEIAPGTRVWMYDAFTTNPLVTEAEVPNVLDSSIVLENGHWAVFNANDNTPNGESCRRLRAQFGQFDLAMLPYSGASEFPSCFRNLNSEEKEDAANRKIEAYLQRLEENIRILEPELTLPFSGQYIIGGRMVEKNRCLGIPPRERAVDRVRGLGYEAIMDREGDVIDILTHRLVHTAPSSPAVSQTEYEDKIRHNPYWFEEAFKVSSDHHVDLFPVDARG